MSHLVQCNRCKKTVDSTDEIVSQEWAELTDKHTNVWDGTIDLCDGCTKDFGNFLRTPPPVPG